MFRKRFNCVLMTALALTGFGMTSTSSAQTATVPDSTLYTTYSIYGAATSINWVVCGSTQQSEGCYDSGNLGPFGHVGAIIDGNEVTSSTATRRKLYVVDDAANGGTGTVLYVYLRIDAINSSFDTTTMKLLNTVNLPLTGGLGAKTYIAANSEYLYIGTNLSSAAVQVRKSTLALGQIGGFSPPMNVSSINADRHGFVTVTFGDSMASSGFYVFNPEGESVEDGGGFDFAVGNTNGLTTADLPASSTSASAPMISASRMQIRPKKHPTQTH